MLRENVCGTGINEFIPRLILLFGLISNHSFSHIPIEVIKINWITAPQYEFVHKLNPQRVLHPAWTGIYKVKLQD